MTLSPDTRVQLTRDWYDLPRGTTARVRYVDGDHSVYLYWSGREELGPDMLRMSEAREVLEAVK